METFCGTLHFMAPELFNDKLDYDQMCDVWSMGVIAYYMLSGTLPFIGKDENALKKKIMTCDYDFEYPTWKNVS